jgi:hypothetical protein
MVKPAKGRSETERARTNGSNSGSKLTDNTRQSRSTETAKAGDDTPSKSLSAGDPLERKTVKELKKQLLKLKCLPVTARRESLLSAVSLIGH